MLKCASDRLALSESTLHASSLVYIYIYIYIYICICTREEACRVNSDKASLHKRAPQRGKNIDNLSVLHIEASTQTLRPRRYPWTRRATAAILRGLGDIPSSSSSSSSRSSSRSSRGSSRCSTCSGRAVAATAAPGAWPGPSLEAQRVRGEGGS